MGGGGGAYLNNRDQITNVGMIHQTGMTFNSTGKCCERQRREPLGGCGGMLPQKIFKSESLKTPFPALSSQ